MVIHHSEVNLPLDIHYSEVILHAIVAMAFLCAVAISLLSLQAEVHTAVVLAEVSTAVMQAEVGPAAVLAEVGPAAVQAEVGPAAVQAEVVEGLRMVRY